jgi:potassium intermediate/small conductance calcium-activated channel subfamily N protein 2
MWVLKCQFKKSPYNFLYLMLTSMVLVMSYLTRVFERAYYFTAPAFTPDQDGYQDYDNFLNLMWLTTVTMTTVGFGDYFCKSHLGRLMTTIVAFFGILLVSLMLVSLDRTTKLNEFQALSYEFINKLQSRELIRHHSAAVVADVLRVCAYKKRKRVLQERRRQIGASVTQEVLKQMD